jgi:hypothetical protein
LRKFLKFLVIIPSLMLIFSACAKKQVIKPSEESVKADRALSAFAQMREAYEARDLSGTLKDVSPDFKKSYADLENNLRKEMERYPKVALEVGVDRVVEIDNFVRVIFHWSGTWTDKDGATHEARGNCTYIYQDTGSSMVLVDYIGDSPFGISR